MSAFVFKATMKADEDAAVPYSFVGVASSNRVDRQDERFTDKAIDSMAQQVPMVLAVGDHKQAQVDVMAEAGTITAFKAEEGNLYISGALDPDHPDAEFLYKKIKAGTAKLSVAGNVTKAQKNVWDADLRKHVNEIDELVLDHVLLCRANAAINQDTAIVAQADADWMGVVFKAAADVYEDACKADLPSDVSYDDLHRYIYEVLKNEFPGGDAWAVEVFPEAVIVEAAGKYYRYGYTYADGEVILGESEEVKQEWVAAAISERVAPNDSEFSTRVGHALTLVGRAEGDALTRSRMFGILVEDLVKGHELSELPEDEGTAKMSDAVEKFATAVDNFIAAKGGEVTKEETAPAETSAEETAEEEQPEAQKAEFPAEVLEILSQVSEALKSFDSRLEALEKTEEAVEEETETEETTKSEDEESTEEPAPDEAVEGEDISTEKAFALVAQAIGDLRKELGSLKSLVDEQSRTVEALEKASPTSAQTRPDKNPVETVAGGSSNPVHDLVMGLGR